MLQAWQAVHPPARGRSWTGQRPKVHAGFLKSWLAGSLKDKVITSVLKALQSCDRKGSPIQRILVTGGAPLQHALEVPLGCTTGFAAATGANACERLWGCCARTVLRTHCMAVGLQL